MSRTFDRKQVSGLVLAGGAGRRVGGRDKGLLLWRERPLVQHVIDRLTPQVGDLLVSCNRNQQDYQRADARLISDLRGDYQGPLAGLEASEAEVETPWLCVVACDLPLLPQDLVARLWHALQASPDTPIACAHDGDRAQYLCALLKPSCIASVTDYLEAGERSVGGWYRTRGLLEVDFSDQRSAFLNLNQLQQTAASEDEA